MSEISRERTQFTMSDTVTHDLFKPLFMRASIFVPRIEANASRIIRGLPEWWFELFDANHQAPFQPQGHLPPEYPIMVITSKSGGFGFSISQNRINFEWNSPNINVDAPDYEQFFDDASKYLLEVTDKFDLQINRLAVNYNRFVRHDNPGLYLAKHFCRDKWWKDQPMNRPGHFELNSHKRYEIYDGLEVNSWVRNKSGQLINPADPIIMVEQDINTLQDDDHNIENEEVERFFNENVAELDKILKLYYPEI